MRKKVFLTNLAMPEHLFLLDYAQHTEVDFTEPAQFRTALSDSTEKKVN